MQNIQNCPRSILWLLLPLLFLCSTATAPAATARIDVYPPDIHLGGKLDRQRFIVVATRDDGVTQDVTDRAKATLGDTAPARLENHTLSAQADGKTVLKVEFDGRSASTSVVVSGAATSRAVSFRLDVMPVFMRAGCNSGACHGSARGQDGFRLSLFGYDPNGDYFRLTREIGFRRINLALPEESLLLEKPTGKVPHTGGKRFGPDSAYYRTLLEWLQLGAKADPGEVPRVEAVELYPPQALLEGAGATQPMVVRAKYADGSNRDVTDLALFLSNNDHAASVSPEGRVTAAHRGEAFVMARFSTYTVGSQVLVLPAGVPYAPPATPPANYIDELVLAKLGRLRIVPAGPSSDAVFLRRVMLDITGRLSTPDEAAAFLADKAADKRARLIDRLLDRPEFSEIWAMQWAELLMVRSGVDVGYKSAYLYSRWLNDQFSHNVPIDQIARQLLASDGGTLENPAANFYQIERDTLKTAENVAQAFLGIRVQCAQCHNHPFDRWTMDDYYSFAALLVQIGRKEGEDDRETIVFSRGGGDVQHPVDNRVMTPKFLGGPLAESKDKDRRQALAEWLTAADNPYFAPNVANRIWAHFFGIGIVEPVDDVRVSNPPSNPQLLQTLAKRLVEYHYDVKRLVRDICNAQAYQRATTGGTAEAFDRNFARARMRRLRAEVLLDCISQVTETKDKFRGLPLGARAVQIADGSTTDYFLTTFGGAPRDSVCACEVQTAPTLSQALHLINGETVYGKVRSGGVVRKLLAAGNTPEQVIRQLYDRCLGRPPENADLEKLKGLAGQAKDVAETLEDVFWALLNSREFVFNH